MLHGIGKSRSEMSSHQMWKQSRSLLRFHAAHLQSVPYNNNEPRRPYNPVFLPASAIKSLQHKSRISGPEFYGTSINLIQPVDTSVLNSSAPDQTPDLTPA
ncbi:hypothetical protein E2P81_ATG07145 [Venturia nashicola]|uniref:Uncharacterized protein n=1 Tax=Venturia nashicola TaxID=86259 RepID=A0A4Z1P2U2_9PEZI|nr:hypothetical protein E6O75_ATG07308 [Venturia nashicola]TLD19528.1 hypothetical protein E2P81_ATG07145 [Venturia nashicola]